MADDFDSVFQRFVEYRLALSQNDIQRSAETRKWFFKQLTSKIENLNGPQLYNECETLNYGSYFCGLKVRDVDEYDALIVLDGYDTRYRSNNVVTAQGRGTISPNRLLENPFLRVDGDVSSRAVLRWLRKITTDVMKPFGGEVPQEDGPAVSVFFKTAEIKIDLVPAVPMIAGTALAPTEFFAIPDKTTDGWKSTDPVKDMDEIKNLSEYCPDLKNVIRALKYIRDSYNMKIDSYIIQRAVVNYALSRAWTNSSFHNFMGALKSLESQLHAGVIRDGFDPKINLLNNVVGTGIIAAQLSTIHSHFGLIHQYGLIHGYVNVDEPVERFDSIASNRAYRGRPMTSMRL